VSVATDGVVFQSDVYAASNNHIVSARRHGRSTWGGRPVLVLLGIRLGLDGVNPIYYDTIKVRLSHLFRYCSFTQGFCAICTCRYSTHSHNL